MYVQYNNNNINNNGHKNDNDDKNNNNDNCNSNMPFVIGNVTTYIMCVNTGI